MDHPEMKADVLVVGAGMGGMTVAGVCAQSGLDVIVVEAAPTIGGSAAMSEGFVWTESSEENFADADPRGDQTKFRSVIGGLEEAFDWLKELGVGVGDWLQMFHTGVGRQIDVLGYFARLKGIIEASGGYIFVNTQPVRLLESSAGAITGARVTRRDTNESVDIVAGATVLATGGFHASEEHRRRYRVPSGNRLLVRGNRYNTGGGLDLGVSVGAALSDGMRNFYGHVVPYPLESLDRADFTLLAQYQVAHGILLDQDGARFCDESRGYSPPAMDVAERGRALLIIDERIRQEHVLGALLPGMDAGVDKLRLAEERGAHYATAATLMELAAAVEGWGYPASGVVSAIEDFNRSLEGRNPRTEIVPPRKRNRAPVVAPPLHALEVQASITFTYGGLATDAEGRVLADTGRPLAGLYAAGVDAGGLNVTGYAGGLVRGLVLGRVVARTIISEQRHLPSGDALSGLGAAP